MSSVWKHKDGKTVRRDQITGPFTWYSIEMLESPAYCTLSLSARRVIDRIRIEHARHGGKENGKLIVTFQDFENYGIHRNAIAPAIREAAALGFIRITQTGRGGNGEFRVPNRFALTHLETGTGRAEETAAPTNDWRRITTMEAALRIAEAARKAPARCGKKQKATPGKRTETTPGKRTETADLPPPETVPLESGTETVPLSISAGGTGPAPSEPQSGNGHAPAAAANGAGAKLKPKIPTEPKPAAPAPKPASNGHAVAAPADLNGGLWDSPEERAIIDALRSNAPVERWEEIEVAYPNAIDDETLDRWPLRDRLAAVACLLRAKLKREGVNEQQIEHTLRILNGKRRSIFH
jgi:hypothetical protein